MANFGPDLVTKYRKVHNASLDIPPPGFNDDGRRSSSNDARLRKMTSARRRSGTLGADCGCHSAGASIAGFSLKRGLKRVGKGVVKLHTAPLKLSGKIAAKVAKFAGKQAARPIKMLFRKLGMRRARFLSWQARRSLSPSASEKARAGVWAAQKFRSKGGPAGKLALLILKHTWGTGVGGVIDSNATGMTGAEILAAVASVSAAMVGVIKSLNKPGEAPANPQQASPENAPAANPAEAPGETPAQSSESGYADMGVSGCGICGLGGCSC